MKRRFVEQRADQLHPLLEYLQLLPSSLWTNYFLCGEVGAGKTTLLRLLLSAFIWQVSPGGIHNCVKSDEADWACELIQSTHMRDRLVRFSPSTSRFNVAAYECGRIGGSPASFARLIQKLARQLDRTKGADKSEQYWESLFFDYLHYGTIACWLASGPAAPITIEAVLQCIMTMPGPLSDKNVAEFRSSMCGKTLMKAQSQAKSAGDVQMLDKATEWITKIQPGLGSKARMAGKQAASSILGKFLLPPFYDCFSSSLPDTFSPEQHPLNQHYVVVDCSVAVFGETGRVVNSLLTTVTVEAALRRPKPTSDILIARDETHLVFTESEQEMLWHSISRQFRLSFWDAAQSLPLLYGAFGGDAKAENEARAFLGNKATHFVFANSEMQTNQFYSSMFGEHREQLYSFNERTPTEPQNIGEAMFGQAGPQVGATESYRPRVTAEMFRHLRKGASANAYLVDFYQTQSGRLFDGLPYKLMTVSQR